jgi:hypothetical protein
MSWAFISALKQNPQQSYVQLLNSIRDVLETKYTQKPQLSCSHPLGTYCSRVDFISAASRSALLTIVISLAGRYRSAFCHVRWSLGSEPVGWGVGLRSVDVRRSFKSWIPLDPPDR